MRKLGLDIGTKTCGVAISDALNITAQGKLTLRFAERDWAALSALLQPIFNEYEIDTVIVGYPTFASGDKSATTLAIEEAVHVLQQHYSQVFKFIREDFSTKEAKALLLITGGSRAKRKAHKDTVSAQLILTDYLAHFQSGHYN